MTNEKGKISYLGGLVIRDLEKAIKEKDWEQAKLALKGMRFLEEGRIPEYERVRSANTQRKRAEADNKRFYKLVMDIIEKPTTPETEVLLNRFFANRLNARLTGISFPKKGVSATQK